MTPVILPEIAERHQRPESVIRWWRWRYDWPQPAGKRGRWDDYDPAEVDRAVTVILALAGSDGDPAELLDITAAAREAGITAGTIRADISRGRWPQPDDYRHGSRRWKRSTVREEMASRRPNKRRQQVS